MVRRVATAMVALLAIALSGCTSAPSLVSAKLDGDLVVFAVCEQIAYDQLTVLSDEKGSIPSSFGETWVAKGLGATGGFVEIRYGVPPRGLETRVGPDALPTSGHYVHFELIGHDDEGAIAGDLFAQFDGDKLVPERWLNSSGELRESPCR